MEESNFDFDKLINLIELKKQDTLIKNRGNYFHNK